MPLQGIPGAYQLALPLFRQPLSLVGDPRRIREKKDMRERLAGEQGGRCCFCGRLFGHAIRHWVAKHAHATLEHFIPRSAGGGDEWENLLAACLRCNFLRGDEDAMEFFERRGWIATHRDRSMESGGWLARAIRRGPAERLSEGLRGPRASNGNPGPSSSG